MDVQRKRYGNKKVLNNSKNKLKNYSYNLGIMVERTNSILKRTEKVKKDYTLIKECVNELDISLLFK